MAPRAGEPARGRYVRQRPQLQLEPQEQPAAQLHGFAGFTMVLQVQPTAQRSRVSVFAFIVVSLMVGRPVDPPLWRAASALMPWRRSTRRDLTPRVERPVRPPL